ncbi:MAG: hypothetical protein ACTSPK_02085 [Candidatus Heimdallarchaeota archaeon]
MSEQAAQHITTQYHTRLTAKPTIFQKWGIFANFIVCVLFFILTITSMFFYPGGNRFDNMAPGFNLLWVALSDLGREFAFNYESNIIARSIFIPGFITLGISFTVFFFVLDSFYKETKKIKWLSFIGAILGAVSGVLYIFIAITPVDVNAGLHNKFIFSAAPFKFGTLICFTIVVFVDKKLPKFVSYLLLAMLIDYIILAVGVVVGTIIGGDINWLIRTFGHTLAIFIEVILCAILSLLLFIHLSKTSKLRLSTGKK